MDFEGHIFLFSAWNLAISVWACWLCIYHCLGLWRKQFVVWFKLFFLNSFHCACSLYLDNCFVWLWFLWGHSSVSGASLSAYSTDWGWWLVIYLFKTSDNTVLLLSWFAFSRQLASFVTERTSCAIGIMIGRSLGHDCAVVFWIIVTKSLQIILARLWVHKSYMFFGLVLEYFRTILQVDFLDSLFKQVKVLFIDDLAQVLIYVNSFLWFNPLVIPCKRDNWLNFSLSHYFLCVVHI